MRALESLKLLLDRWVFLEELVAAPLLVEHSLFLILLVNVVFGFSEFGHFLVGVLEFAFHIEIFSLR